MSDRIVTDYGEMIKIAQRTYVHHTDGPRRVSFNRNGTAHFSKLVELLEACPPELFTDESINHLSKSYSIGWHAARLEDAQASLVQYVRYQMEQDA